MRRLRYSAVALVLLLGGLLAVGRLDVAGVSGPTPYPVLFMVVATVAALLLVPRLAGAAPTALAAVVALGVVVLEAYAVDGIALDGGARFWQTLAEVTLAVLSVLVARRMARQLDEVEDVVANVTIADARRVKSLEDAEQDIAVEMARARRHERPLTVTVLSVDPDTISGQLHQVVRDIQQRMLQRYVLSGLARLVAQSTRRGDLVVQDPVGRRVIIISPEAEPHQIEVLAQRLQIAARETLGVPIELGLAAFPESALTFDDLVERASSPPVDEPSIRAMPVARHHAVDGPTPERLDTLPAGD